jgi:hypothetical protein
MLPTPVFERLQFRRLPGKALPGKSAGQVCRAKRCRASLPGKSAGQVCRASLSGKSVGPVCQTSLQNLDPRCTYVLTREKSERQMTDRFQNTGFSGHMTTKNAQFSVLKKILK